MTGFINVWKREGDTSAYVVNRLKRLTRTPCGHMGTLDPLASGVLPVGIGNATRLFDYFLEKQKVYLAHFRFGVTTPTLDYESDPIVGGCIPTAQEIEAVLPQFIGEIAQIPPVFSAKCVNGKRSYELAREGKEVSLAAKTVKIERLDLLEQTDRDEFTFRITCGGGTYIRSLARDIAAALGTQGFMSGLVREQSGVFSQDNAVLFEELTAETVEKSLIRTEDVLPFPSMTVTDIRFYNGIHLPCDRTEGLYKIYNEDGFYGLARVTNGKLYPEKKLC